MDIVYETERKLIMAICYNKVIDYLEGVGIYKINSNPKDVTSPHNFNFSMECYNKFAATRPQLKLDQLFVEEIISRLKSDKCYVYEVYYIFNCIVAQLRLEKNNLSSFTIENSKLNEMFQILREKVLALRDDLKSCKDEKGEYYTDGMYGYMQTESNRVYNEVGRRIL